ncbi:MAG TPA: hypothetical protein VJY39_02845 [Acidisphaera sp.]|nr:hypothetical protein [Acidisphaera sp.]
MADDLAQAQRAWMRDVFGVRLGLADGPRTDGPRTDGPPKGVVAYRKALLAFGAARMRATSEARALANDIAEALPEEADLAERVADEVDAFCDTLGDTIDAGINALSDGRAEQNAAVKREVLALIDRVAADKLIAHVDRNPLRPVAIAQTLTAALKGVADTVV